MNIFYARPRVTILSVLLSSLAAAVLFPQCRQPGTTVDRRIKLMDTLATARMAKAIEATVTPELEPGLTLHLYGIDSMVISPVAIDVDDSGKVYYVTTGRQKNSEFDIRNHKDWETESTKLQTVEEKRAFLHKMLSPEKSSRNLWLKDLNGDSSHDWKDLTVETEKVYRLQDLNGDGVADISQLVVNDFHDEVTDVAAGLLADGDNLYVAVGPDLWRLKDTNGDGVVDEKTSLSTGYGIHIGFSGHGMSGVEMGPDGRIYWQIGDIGFSGKGPDGQKWEYPNSGVIARSNPDGSDFEIFASGIRNTHEFVFDEYANIISEDNDGDHAGELERLVYIVNGADIGWRSNWQYGKYIDPDNNTYKVWMDEKMHLPRFEGQAAYITPCISNFVSGPTGLAYNPGTALGPAYRNTFFVVEFVGNPSASGIHSFRLNQDGASFTLGDHKKIVNGILATGIEFGPDGALYISDWIEGWATKSFGRIWKLDNKNSVQSPERAQTKSLLAERFSDRKDEELGLFLKYPDMRVRQKAQFELVKRGAKGAEIFGAVLSQASDRLARVHAIWGISQLARQDKKYAEMLLPLTKDKDAEIRAQAAKWLGDIRYKGAGDLLIDLLKDTNSRASFFAAEALGRIGYVAAINPLISLLEANNEKDAYLRHAGSLALARIGKPAPLIALSASPSRAVRIAAVVALRRLSDPGIAVFLNDKDEFVVTEAARAINDDLSIEKALPALGNLLKTTSFTNEALIRRAVNANLRSGTEMAMQNLISYAQNPGAPVKMRAEAIDALSVWTKPSVLDRVDGRYRGEINRDPSLIRSKVSNALIGFLNNKDLPMRLSAAKAIARLDIKQAAPALALVLKTAKQPGLRIESLKAIVDLKDEKVSDAIRLAISDRDKMVRIAGLELLEKLNISKELMINLLSEVISKQTAEEKQAAILTLGRLPFKNSERPLTDLLEKMAGGKLSPDVYLELGEAVDSSHSPQLMEKYKGISAKISTDQLTAAYAGSLTGGDPERGKDIFYENQTAQCIRCHTYDDQGGNAGPRLNGIATRISRSQILEALISPSARLSPGFGMVNLELKNGKKIFGILKNENGASLSIKVGDQPEQSIKKSDIVNKTNAPSSMPDMKLLLSKKEIRDVVSFLATAKTP